MRAMERLSCAARVPALVLATLLVWGSAGRGQAPPPGKMIVADVQVVGARLVPPQLVKNTVRTRPGAEYNQGIVQDDIRRLLETRQFGPNTRAEYKVTGEDQVTVYFVVEELPNTIQEIVYNGAKHLKDKELEEITGLRKNGPMYPIGNQLARQAILRKYQEKGRLFASCELVEGGKPGDKRVVFNITEGPVVKVSSIGFQGNSFVSEGRLKTQVNSSKIVLGLFGGEFNPDMADADVAKLEEYYRSFGYQGVRVSRELQWEQDQRRVRLVFHIHEGQRYKVTNVDVAGSKYYDRDKLLSGVRLRSGGWYDENAVQADMQTIKDLYGYHGREVMVNRELAYGRKPASARLAWSATR
jgi:outer membrane protein insertion porin family